MLSYTVELAIHYNHRFAGWQTFEGFANKREAWSFIKAQGYTEKDKNIEWMAYPSAGCEGAFV